MSNTYPNNNIFDANNLFGSSNNTPRPLQGQPRDLFDFDDDVSSSPASTPAHQVAEKTQAYSPSPQPSPQQRQNAVTQVAGSSAYAAASRGNTPRSGGAKRPASSGASTSRKPAPRQGGGGGGGNRGGKKDSTAKYVWRYILRAFFVLACLGIIAGSLFAIPVVKYMVESTQNDDEILNLETLKRYENSKIFIANPDNPATVEDAVEANDWIEYQALSSPDINSMWADWDEIPQSLKDAMVATEDRSFEKNTKGFYIGRTVKAALNEVLKFDRTFGASSIDQQLVKNITGEKEVTGEDGEAAAGYKRKLREIYRAYNLNKNYSKDMILEAYLNTMPLSGTIVGARAGAFEYFDKNISDLTIAESAMIAGITQSPGKYNPFTNPEECLKRRNDVLYFMLQTEKITQEEFDREVATELQIARGQSTTAQQEANSYFSDTIFEAVVGDLMALNDWDRATAVRYYYTGGLRIYATMDANVQNEMEIQYEKGYGDQREGFIFPELTAEHEVKDKDGNVTETKTVYTQSAMVVMDYNGALKGVVGGVGEKTESLVQNRATQSIRQIGSTMKPLTAYALGIEKNYIDYSSILPDSYLQDNWPGNFSGAPTNQPMLVTDALAQSTNTIAARAGDRVGAQEMFDFLQDTLQISSLVSEGGTNDIALAPLVLGALTDGISTYEVAAAYQIFGNGGQFTTPHCYYYVTDIDGNIILKPDTSTVQAIKPETAYIVNRLMSNVLRSSSGSATGVSGTARGMALSYMDSIAKTGTTGVAGRETDRYFIGLTPYYVSAVWWGYDTNESIAWPAKASTNPPALMWKTVMEAAQQNLPEKSFEVPSGITAVPFCRETGNLAGPNCADVQTGYYDTGGRMPNECTTHAAPEAPPPADPGPPPAPVETPVEPVPTPTPAPPQETEPPAPTDTPPPAEAPAQ